MMIVARFLRHVVVMRRWTTHGGVLTHDRVVAFRYWRRWRRRLWLSHRARPEIAPRPGRRWRQRRRRTDPRKIQVAHRSGAPRNRRWSHDVVQLRTDSDWFLFANIVHGFR